MLRKAIQQAAQAAAEGSQWQARSETQRAATGLLVKEPEPCKGDRKTRRPDRTRLSCVLHPAAARLAPLAAGYHLPPLARLIESLLYNTSE